MLDALRHRGPDDESIWQGEVSGSYHFESEARRLLENFKSGLEPEPNAQTFGVKPTVGRW